MGRSTCGSDFAQYGTFTVHRLFAAFVRPPDVLWVRMTLVDFACRSVYVFGANTACADVKKAFCLIVF